MKYIIYAPWEYRSSSGGVIALHKLAHDLNTLGEEAYVYAESVCDELNYKFLDSRVILSREFVENAIVIYTEVVLGNPLNATRVVRWLLNGVGVLGGDASTWGNRDKIYTFAEYFKGNLRINGTLTVLKPDLDFWIDERLPRKGQCYVIRKGIDKELNFHKKDAVLVDNMDNLTLKKMFNTCEEFICYDSECFYAVQAVLCGCRTVVIPKKGISASEWKLKFPYFRFGIPYGFEDYESFNSQLTRNNIKGLQESCMETVKNFINDQKN